METKLRDEIPRDNDLAYLAILYLKYLPLCHERNQLPKIDCDILSHVRLAPQLLQFRENLRRLRSKIVQWPRQIAAVHIP